MKVLYRGTTSGYIKGKTLFTRHLHMEEGWPETPRLYFVEDPGHAIKYAIKEARTTGGVPYIVTIDAERLKPLLKRDPWHANDWQPGNLYGWYIELSSWSAGLPIIESKLRVKMP